MPVISLATPTATAQPWPWAYLSFPISLLLRHVLNMHGGDVIVVLSAGQWTSAGWLPAFDDIFSFYFFGSQ